MANELSVEKLKKFHPLSQLHDDELATLKEQVTVANLPPGKNIIDSGSDDPRVVYLLQGKVELIAQDGKSLTVEAGTDKALQPLSRLIPHQYTIRSVTDVSFFRVESDLLNQLNTNTAIDQYDVHELLEKNNLLDCKLFHDLHNDLLENRFVIPTLPDLALRVRRAMESDDVDIEKVARIIQMDPAITSRLIHVANSALFAKHSPVSTCIEAVLRLGLNTTRNLIICFTLSNLFKTSQRIIKEHMRDLWKHSTRVAAISYVLAAQNRRLNPDHALLLGLLHDVGVLAIISYAGKYKKASESEEQLNAVIKQFRGDIGAMILEQWGFGDEFIECAQNADDYTRDTKPEADYIDVIQVAQLHSFMGSEKADTLPTLSDTPAFIKLFSSDNNPEVSLKILEDAHTQIKEVMSWLTEKQ